ncbi:hypothetical protein glysoja_034409 [Glycine soja]|uniref:NADH:ubiquinone reductase (non-electrogenic) n=1 Tax=Glycine soja TaxID=3848 RepID=A0A0B2PXS0_GLYSO|nr:hypothetical protein glysoja_034409 [Glycine soja]
MFLWWFLYIILLITVICHSLCFFSSEQASRHALATDEWLRVASQRGTYLAKCFNRMEECEKNPEGPLRFKGEGQHRFKPFRYKHLGQFAPLGGEQTIAQLPGYWVSIGHSSQCQHKQAYICGPLHLCSSPMGV